MLSRRTFLGTVAASAVVPNAFAAGGRKEPEPYAGRVLANGRPMPGVIVSNGLDCVRTDAGGKYVLPRHANTRFVTVTTPSGWRCEWNSFHGDSWRYRDFRLEPWAASGGKGCTFVQVADSEVSSVRDHQDWLGRVKRHADESASAFIVHTGDICGRRGIVAHRQIMNEGTMGRPVVYCIGNHDMCEGERGEMVFESVFGPCWWSFEAGGVHFCVTPMPCGDFKPGYTPDEVADWLRNDLGLIDPKMPVVLFNHTLCNEHDAERCGVVYGQSRPLDLRKACNFKGFIYGHYHNTYFRRRDGVALTTSTNPAMGGIDHSVETIKVFHVDETGAITSDNHHADDVDWKPSDAGAVWTAKLAGEVLYGTPVVSGDRVFVAAADDEGKGRQAVYALDGRDGRTVWRTATVNSVKNRMLLVRGRLIAVDAEGFVYAFSADDGRELWRRQLRFSPFVVVSAPTLAPDGRTVVVGLDRRMMSVDVETGAVNWSGVDASEGEPCPNRPAIADGRILNVVNWRGTFCHDLATGKSLWTHKDNPPERYSGPDPVIRDGKAILFGQTSVVEYAMSDGREIRRVACADSFTAPCGRPLYANGLCIVGTARGGLVALDELTYGVKWRGTVGSSLVGLSAYRRLGESIANTEPILLPGGRVAAAAADGAIHVWDLADGKTVREIRTGVPYLAGLAAQDGCLFAADLRGYVRKFVIHQGGIA